MGGGLMQLVAVGAQDVFLTSNPQITFFKVVYRRHTNFSNETIKQVINGSQVAGGTGNVSISRNGDLVHRVYVNVPVTVGTDGDNVISSVEVEIGGQKIDKHTSEWNQIWAELNVPASKAEAYKCMTGNVGNALVQGVGQLQIPLNFWFCRNAGLALPLIALQYHEVKLKCVWGSYTGNRSVHVDYIYLDTDERRRFAQVSHEYLIEQVQDNVQIGTSKTSIDLHLNHPVKELIWTSPATNGYETARITLNGQDRFEAQQEEYFQLRQPFDHHTAVPGQNVVLSSRPQMLTDHINIYSLGLGNWNRFEPNPTDTSQTCKIVNGVATLPEYHDDNIPRSNITGVPLVGDIVKVIQKGSLNVSNPDIILTTGKAKAGTSVVTGEGMFVIDTNADTETLSGSGSGGGAHLSFWSTTYPYIVKGDRIELIYTTVGGSGGSPHPRTIIVKVFEAGGNTAAALAGGSAVGRYAYTLDADLASNMIDTFNIGGMFSIPGVLNIRILPRDMANGLNVDVGISTVTEITGDYSFKLSDTSINVNNDFKVHIIARSQEALGRVSSLTSKINVYSFALKPEEHQPSGTCNFSRIDTAQLKLGTALASAGKLYAVNYNILRIQAGMGGLAYSN
jgi:hypothetical protein